MAKTKIKSLSEVVKEYRSSGSSAVGSLGSGIKEKLKERFDPRQLINQKGILPALFPSLKAFRAGKPEVEKDKITKIDSLSTVKPFVDSMSVNTSIIAKNSMVLPMMHRDINVMRQNMVKLVKLRGGKAATKVDAMYMSTKDRNAAYKVQSTPTIPTKEKDTEESNGGVLSGVIAVLAGIAKSLMGIGEKIGSLVTSALSGLGNMIVNGIKGLFTIGKLATSLLGSLIKPLLGFLVSPLGLGILLTTGLIIALRTWLYNVAENMTNFKAIGAKEAHAVLKSGSERDINAFGGADYLRSVILNSGKRAREILEMEEGDEKTKAIAQAGGIIKVQENAKITEDMARSLFQEVVNVNPAAEPNTVKPRPNENAGSRGKLQAQQWDEKYKDKYDPKTGEKIGGNKPMAVGDSIAMGMILQGGAQGTTNYGKHDVRPGGNNQVNNFTDTAVGGRTPTQVLRTIEELMRVSPDKFKGQEIILSTGASNTGGVFDEKTNEIIAKQIKSLYDAGAKSVTVLGVGSGQNDLFDKNNINQKLKAVAESNKAVFQDIKSAGMMSDKVHLSSQGSKNIVNSVSSKMQPNQGSSNTSGSTLDSGSTDLKNGQKAQQTSNVVVNNKTENNTDSASTTASSSPLPSAIDMDFILSNMEPLNYNGMK